MIVVLVEETVRRNVHLLLKKKKVGGYKASHRYNEPSDASMDRY